MVQSFPGRCALALNLLPISYYAADHFAQCRQHAAYTRRGPWLELSYGSRLDEEGISWAESVDWQKISKTKNRPWSSNRPRAILFSGRTCFGAEGGVRTHKPVRATDFKSAASAHFATSAWGDYLHLRMVMGCRDTMSWCMVEM